MRVCFHQAYFKLTISLSCSFVQKWAIYSFIRKKNRRSALCTLYGIDSSLQRSQSAGACCLYSTSSEKNKLGIAAFAARRNDVCHRQRRRAVISSNSSFLIGSIRRVKFQVGHGGAAATNFGGKV